MIINSFVCLIKVLIIRVLLIIIILHCALVRVQVLVPVGTSYQPVWATLDTIQPGKLCQHSPSERDSKIQVSHHKNNAGTLLVDYVTINARDNVFRCMIQKSHNVPYSGKFWLKGLFISYRVTIFSVFDMCILCRSVAHRLKILSS